MVEDGTGRGVGGYTKGWVLTRLLTVFYLTYDACTTLTYTCLHGSKPVTLSAWVQASHNVVSLHFYSQEKPRVDVRKFVKIGRPGYKGSFLLKAVFKEGGGLIIYHDGTVLNAHGPSPLGQL